MSAVSAVPASRHQCLLRREKWRTQDFAQIFHPALRHAHEVRVMLILPRRFFYLCRALPEQRERRRRRMLTCYSTQQDRLRAECHRPAPPEYIAD